MKSEQSFNHVCLYGTRSPKNGSVSDSKKKLSNGRWYYSFFIDNSVARLAISYYLSFMEGNMAQNHCQRWWQALALNEIVSFRAVVTEGNIASERVLQKCGFTLSQVMPQAYSIAGKRYDDRIYLKV